jgi:hypothetical protein
MKRVFCVGAGFGSQIAELYEGQAPTLASTPRRRPRFRTTRRMTGRPEALAYLRKSTRRRRLNATRAKPRDKLVHRHAFDDVIVLHDARHLGEQRNRVRSHSERVWPFFARSLRIVSCVPGSPIDCAAMTPTASPMLTF